MNPFYLLSFALGMILTAVFGVRAAFALALLWAFTGLVLNAEQAEALRALRSRLLVWILEVLSGYGL